MKQGEKLFKFLANLILQKFYGNVIIRFEAGKATHVETETRRAWRYGDLPERAEPRDDESIGPESRVGGIMK